MAVCYAPPEHIDAPEIDLRAPVSEWDKAEDAYIAKMAEYCKSRSKCKDAGAVVRFLVGDGFAKYMVLSYSKLIFLPLMDEYEISDAHMRGLRADDIKAMI